MYFEFLCKIEVLPLAYSTRYCFSWMKQCTQFFVIKPLWDGSSESVPCSGFCKVVHIVCFLSPVWVLAEKPHLSLKRKKFGFFGYLRSILPWFLRTFIFIQTRLLTALTGRRPAVERKMELPHVERFETFVNSCN